MDWLSRLPIQGTFLPHDIGWNPQTPSSIGTSTLLCVFRIVLLVLDFIAEEAGRLGARLSNQRLLFRQFPFEFLAQEEPEFLLDFFCFLSWTGEAEQGVG
jgi:hypothetical protein